MKLRYIITILVLVFIFLSIDAFAQSKRKIVSFKRPDGVKGACILPPDDVLTKKNLTIVNTQIPNVISILKKGGSAGLNIDRNKEFERVREELSDLNIYEVMEFRLCMQYGNGVLTAEEYKEGAKELRPKQKLPTQKDNSSQSDKVSDFFTKNEDVISSWSEEVNICDFTNGTDCTHEIISKDEPYFKNGPQQKRPADGTFALGTKVLLVRGAGSYSLVISREGVTAYVYTAALKSLKGVK